MPLSKKRNRERMAAVRAKKKAHGAVLMSKSMARRLHRLGVDPGRYLRLAEVSLDDYRALERTLEAKTQRVEWQSSGIRKLHQTVAYLETKLAMVEQDASAQRITQLEADLARLEVMLDSTPVEEWAPS